MLKSDSKSLFSGTPILYAEGQFVACHFSPSNYVPFRKIGKKHLEEELRRAMCTEDRRADALFENSKREEGAWKDNYEMIYLKDSCTAEDSSKEIILNQKDPKQQKQLQQGLTHFMELLQWISQEGDEFVYIESLRDSNDVFILLDAIGKCRNPVLINILICDNEPNKITVSLSNVTVSLQSLLFCMFPT